MPNLRRRSPPPNQWSLSTGAGAGPSSKNFFILGDSIKYNEHYAPRNPPAEEYTHVLHFQDLKQNYICRIPDRIGKIWWSSSGKAYAVGNPEGIFQIDSTGCQEIAIRGLSGVFTAIWGTGEDHIFACGIFKTFILYRRFGTWIPIALPTEMTSGLFGIAGFHERDVYFIGSKGTILHFDGQDLRSLDVPTTWTLVSIAILDDQHLCVGGYGGMLLFGNKTGWRIVPTNSDEPLYSLARFGESIYFPFSNGVWSFDGSHTPILRIEQPAIWINGLGDALTLSDLISTWLFDGQSLIELDTVLRQ